MDISPTSAGDTHTACELDDHMRLWPHGIAGEAEGSEEDCQQEDMDSDLADADKAHSNAGTGVLDEQSDQEMQTGNTHQHHDKTADENAEHGQTKKRRAVLYESDDE